METKPLVVIVGETASGKSDLAVKLAKQLNGEIISADSWQVYKEFDIGTAKPSKAEQKQIPHHLIDVADPRMGFSAAEFKKLADRAILSIQKHGRLPILVGGSGLYVDSVIYGYSFLPAGSDEYRQELNALGLEELLKQIKNQEIDLKGIDTRNKRRLIRLVENKGQRPTKQKLRPNTIITALKLPKEELTQRIAKRVDNMLAKGLEKEVRQLSKKYSWGTEPMKGIGYREFKDYFEGQQTIEQTRARIINSSLQLAKKQRTWFKRNKSIHWANSQREAVAFVTTVLNK